MSGEEKKINYVGGISIHQARKFFKFYFGSFLYEMKKNNGEWRYDLYLMKSIYQLNEEGKKESIDLKDCFDLNEFKQYWGPGFHLIIVDKVIEEEL